VTCSSKILTATTYFLGIRARIFTEYLFVLYGMNKPHVEVLDREHTEAKL
jgi:hypothetical protein